MYLEDVIENPLQTEILAVFDTGDWLWERDEHSTAISDTVTVLADVTSGGETTRREVHFALREDGTLGWFTDCGEPLP